MVFPLIFVQVFFGKYHSFQLGAAVSTSECAFISAFERVTVSIHQSQVTLFLGVDILTDCKSCQK